MSTYDATVVECDGVQCSRRVVVPQGGASLSRAEKHLGDIGWQIAAGSGVDLDYCPWCLTDEKRRTGKRRPGSPASSPGPVPSKPEGDRAGSASSP